MALSCTRQLPSPTRSAAASETLQLSAFPAAFFVFEGVVEGLVIASISIWGV